MLDYSPTVDDDFFAVGENDCHDIEMDQVSPEFENDIQVNLTERDINELSIDAQYDPRLFPTRYEKLRRIVKSINLLYKGRGICKRTIPLRKEHFLEAILPQHYMGTPLQKFIKAWNNDTKTKLAFDEWLELQNKDDLEKVKVSYYDEAERKKHLIEIKDGKLVQNGVPFNTSGYKAFYSSTDFAIFVMAPDDSIYAAQYSYGKIHHSSFLSGSSVKFSGELKTDEQGNIVQITNKSGHYWPGEDNLLLFLEVLCQKGVNLSQTQLKVLTPEGIEVTYDSAEQYLKNKGILPPNTMDLAYLERNDQDIVKLHFAKDNGFKDCVDRLRYLAKKGVDIESLCVRHNLPGIPNPYLGSDLIAFIEGED